MTGLLVIMMGLCRLVVGVLSEFKPSFDGLSDKVTVDQNLCIILERARACVVIYAFVSVTSD
jgi:hypothetical protein